MVFAQLLQFQSIRVVHLHVDQMPSVMVMGFANACQSILEIHMKAVDLNVLLAVSAQEIKRVFETNAKILVLVHVDKTQIVMLLIMYQLAHVHLIW